MTIRFVVSLCAVLTALARVPQAGAQVTFAVDPGTSLAWWQVNPHLNHLWATTCPEEPTWKPGEGRSGGWIMGDYQEPKEGYAAVSDTMLVPLYPRPRALNVCTEALSGEISVRDTIRWEGVRGRVEIQADALVSGENRRDAHARKTVFQTTRFREIVYTIDSVANVVQRGDTMVATAFGSLTFRQITRPANGPVKAWREKEGLRVTGRVRYPAWSLIEEFGVSKFALGLGVGAAIWKDIFMGVDVILRPATED